MVFTGKALLKTTSKGLVDQQFTPPWVQAPAAAFGGDPAKVTIW